MADDTTFETGTLAEQSYEYLRSEILTNRLTPGVILSEVALAARLGVSRGPCARRFVNSPHRACAEALSAQRRSKRANPR